MSVEIIDQGRGNRIELSPWFNTNGKLKITLTGDNNEILIPEPLAQCGQTVIQLGSRCAVHIGAAVRLSNGFIVGHEQARLSIGPHTSFTFEPRFLLHEPSRISIGKDCLIASGVQFMTSPMHTVFDMTSGQRINPAKDILVEDHVWIGQQCVIVHGASIGHDAIIGMRSVVDGSIPAHSLASGTPAIVRRTKVGWDRKLWKNSPEAAETMLYAL